MNLTGELYIDGIDAFSAYRVFVDGGYGGLITFPTLKALESNDWAEDDGAEFDLSAPVLDTRELSMKFAFAGVDAMFGWFMEQLSDMAYHTFDFRVIGRIYRLRLVTHSALVISGNLGLFTLNLANDFPLDGYTYLAPVSGDVSSQGYELDGVDLSEYGIYVLKGSAAEIQKSPAVKKNLLTNIKTRSGAIYDDRYVKFQTKEVKLNCFMQAKTLPELWRNYDALLYDLIRPNERLLYVDSVGEEYPCYYKSNSIEKFAATGKIWLQFSLSLMFTSFRVDGEELLLASEDGKLIITETEDFAIDLIKL